MRVNFIGLDPSEFNEKTFWRFLSCAISGNQEFLDTNPNLSDLTVKMTLNGVETDLVKSWELYSKSFSNSLNSEPVEEPTAQDTSIISPSPSIGNIDQLMDSISSIVRSEIECLEECYDTARQCASSVASDIAADYASERVHEALSDEAPSFEYRADQIIESIESRLRNRANT